MGVDGCIGFTSQSCTLGVADAEDLCALLLGVANCHQSVHGFAGLANCQNQSVFINHWIAVTEFVS